MRCRSISFEIYAENTTANGKYSGFTYSMAMRGPGAWPPVIQTNQTICEHGTIKAGACIRTQLWQPTEL